MAACPRLVVFAGPRQRKVRASLSAPASFLVISPHSDNIDPYILPARQSNRRGASDFASTLVESRRPIDRYSRIFYC